MTNTKTYEKRTHINNTTIERVVDFHQDPKALPKLTPPPIFVQLNRDDRRSLTEGEIEFTLWFGPMPVRWIASHAPGPNEHSFVDEMVKGPMAYWHHQHIIEETDDGVALIDRVTYAHDSGIKGLLTRLLFDGIPLRILFFYRHLRTRMAVT